MRIFLFVVFAAIFVTGCGGGGGGGGSMPTAPQPSTPPPPPPAGIGEISGPPASPAIENLPDQDFEITSDVPQDNGVLIGYMSVFLKAAATTEDVNDLLSSIDGRIVGSSPGNSAIVLFFPSVTSLNATGAIHAQITEHPTVLDAVGYNDFGNLVNSAEPYPPSPQQAQYERINLPYVWNLSERLDGLVLTGASNTEVWVHDLFPDSTSSLQLDADVDPNALSNGISTFPSGYDANQGHGFGVITPIVAKNNSSNVVAVHPNSGERLTLYASLVEGAFSGARSYSNTSWFPQFRSLVQATDKLVVFNTSLQFAYSQEIQAPIPQWASPSAYVRAISGLNWKIAIQGTNASSSIENEFVHVAAAGNSARAETFSNTTLPTYPAYASPYLVAASFADPCEIMLHEWDSSTKQLVIRTPESLVTEAAGDPNFTPLNQYEDCRDRFETAFGIQVPPALSNVIIVGAADGTSANQASPVSADYSNTKRSNGTPTVTDAASTLETGVTTKAFDGITIFPIEQNTSYAPGTGTSFAAPQIAALIAVLIDFKENITVEEVMQLVIDASSDVGNPERIIDAYELVLSIDEFDGLNEGVRHALLDVDASDLQPVINASDLQIWADAFRNAVQSPTTLPKFSRFDINADGNFQTAPSVGSQLGAFDINADGEIRPEPLIVEYEFDNDLYRLKVDETGVGDDGIVCYLAFQEFLDFSAFSTSDVTQIETLVRDGFLCPPFSKKTTAFAYDTSGLIRNAAIPAIGFDPASISLGLPPRQGLVSFDRVAGTFDYTPTVSGAQPADEFVIGVSNRLGT
ncbi:MAG: S8 family serine peptidase, partial [Henriciella sp.]|nr:S8 family serine peptidase [Henriciella sp.]